MTTPASCTFDLTPPRRPGIDDVGGGAKQDDIFFPPDPVTMPTGADDNQHQRQIVALGSVAAVALITVHFSGGTPSVAMVSSVRTGFVPGSITVTDEGLGVTKLTWLANVLPSPVADHGAWPTGTTVGGQAVAETISLGVRVRTTNAAGAAADVPFVAVIF